jgi:hypothetical protein
MKKLVAASLLAISLFGFVSDAGAQQFRGRAFGSANCAFQLPCDISFGSGTLSIETMATIAKSCASKEFGMSLPGNYFDTNSGLDSNKCLQVQTDGQNLSGTMQASCCLSPETDQGDTCTLVCAKISVR